MTVDSAYSIQSVFGNPARRSNHSTTRQTIPIGCRGRHINIIVVRISSGSSPSPWGKRMGKAGRKRKELVNREKNGRAARPTSERLNELNRQSQMLIKGVVLNQPHRRGVDDPWMALAAGRFCRAHAVERVVYEACEAYLNFERRWQAGYGVPKGYEHHSGGGSGNGPTEEQMRTWLSRIQSVETALQQKFGNACFQAVHRLVIDDIELGHQDDARAVKSALAEIAVVLGMTGKSLHPFSGVR